MPADDNNVFVTHTLKGTRFDLHAMPVEVLPELNAYRDLVLAVARARFFAEQPTRRRLPKGFEDAFRLSLRTIQPGSAAAPLERVVPIGTARSLPNTSDRFETARDLIAAAIEAAHRGQPLPEDFPLEAVTAFNQFGRTLRDDEHIVIHSPNGTTTTYDRRTRKRLVLYREETYEDYVDEIGAIVALDRDKSTFELALEAGRRVPGRLDQLDEASAALVRNAVAGEERVQVRVVGVGAFDRNDRLIRLTAIDEVTYAEDEELKSALDVGKRLKVFATLADGWFEGDGTSFSAELLRWVERVLVDAIDNGLPRPYLYPTPAGGVLAEWSFADAEVSADIDLQRRSATLVGTKLKSGAMREDVLDMSTLRSPEQLVAFVAAFSPEGAVRA